MKFAILIALSTIGILYGSDTAIDVRSAGIVADGVHDDTAALNALFRSVPDFSEIDFPAGAKVRITGTLIIAGKNGLKLIGRSGIGNSAAPLTTAPQLLWSGSDGGTMLGIDKSQGLIVEQLAFFGKASCSQSGSQADIAIDVDQSSPNPGGITTDNLFRRLAVVMCDAQRPSFIGMRFSHKSLENVEHMRVEDSTFYCSGDGSAGVAIEVGPSANAKNYKLMRNGISNCQYGIHLLGGSVEAGGNMFNTNQIDIYAPNYVDNLTVHDNVTENSQQFLVAAGIWPIEVSNNKIATLNTPAGHGMIEVTYAYLTAKGNKFDQSLSGPAFQGHSGAGLMSLGNEYPANSYASTGWSTFESGVVTLQDKMIDPATNAARPTGIAMSGATNFVPVPMAGVGIIYYDAATRKFKVSEDGNAFVDLVPLTATSISSNPSISRPR